MGSRGASSGKSSGVSTTQSIKDEFMNIGLNSKFKGVKRNAENGEGAYYFKDYKAVGDNDLKNMKNLHIAKEDNGKTLITGTIGQKSVVYGNKTDSKQIQNAKAQIEKSKYIPKVERPETRTTTTTYDRWLKKSRKEGLERYYGSSKANKLGL